MVPVTRYAQSGDAKIAYQAVGEGALDMMFLPGWISQIEQLWELPALHRFLERLGSFSRVIMFDRRGGGLSDRVLGDYSLEQDAQDALAEGGGERRLSAVIVRRDTGQLFDQAVQVRAADGQDVGVGGDAEAGRDG